MKEVCLPAALSPIQLLADTVHFRNAVIFVHSFEALKALMKLHPLLACKCSKVSIEHLSTTMCHNSALIGLDQSMINALVDRVSLVEPDLYRRQGTYTPVDGFCISCFVHLMPDTVDRFHCMRSIVEWYLTKEGQVSVYVIDCYAF